MSYCGDWSRVGCWRGCRMRATGDARRGGTAGAGPHGHNARLAKAPKAARVHEAADLKARRHNRSGAMMGLLATDVRADSFDLQLAKGERPVPALRRASGCVRLGSSRRGKPPAKDFEQAKERRILAAVDSDFASEFSGKSSAVCSTCGG